MNRALLLCAAILIPLGTAQAENWKNKTMKPPAVAATGAVVCLSNANCWCRSKHKTFTPGETCQCGPASGVLKRQGQISQGVPSCN
jgi:hypothetical protein